jgi:Na+/proline symporter
LRYGVLGWGLPTAFFFCLAHGFLNGWGAFWAELIPAFILFPFGGIFFGRFMWRMLEKKHTATPHPHVTK